MTSAKYRQVLKNLQALGFKSKSFTLDSEGKWAPEDAEWNYYDVPHLNEVHSQADAATLYTLERYSSSILRQRVGPISLPAIVSIFESSEHSIAYASTIGPFIICVESSWALMDFGTTRVQTTYTISTTKIWAPWTWVIRKLLVRNYGILMSEDLPMRERRGQLRELGYTFTTDKNGSTFIGSTDLRSNNVLVPQLPKDSWSLATAEILSGEDLYVGPTDVRGVRLKREGDQIFFYPRMCLHEGALLDGIGPNSNGVKCPWHGRVERKLGVLDLGGNTNTVELGQSHRVSKSEDRITIEYTGIEQSRS